MITKITTSALITNLLNAKPVCRHFRNQPKTEKKSICEISAIIKNSLNNALT